MFGRATEISLPAVQWDGDRLEVRASVAFGAPTLHLNEDAPNQYTVVTPAGVVATVRYVAHHAMIAKSDTMMLPQHTQTRCAFNSKLQPVPQSSRQPPLIPARLWPPDTVVDGRLDRRLAGRQRYHSPADALLLSSGELKIECSLYPCDSATDACSMKSFVWTIPFTRGQGGAASTTVAAVYRVDSLE